jgi:hypothetical protein
MAQYPFFLSDSFIKNGSPGPAIFSRVMCAWCSGHAQTKLESEKGRPWLSIEPSGDEKYCLEVLHPTAFS